MLEPEEILLLNDAEGVLLDKDSASSSSNDCTLLVVESADNAQKGGLKVGESHERRVGVTPIFGPFNREPSSSVPVLGSVSKVLALRTDGGILGLENVSLFAKQGLQLSNNYSSSIHIKNGVCGSTI
jgi:hypothetical protein